MKSTNFVRPHHAAVLCFVMALSIGSQGPVLAQDAFNTLGDCHDSIYSAGEYRPDENGNGDAFDQEAPMLQGATNGTIGPSPEEMADRHGVESINGSSVFIPASEFRKATRLPDAATLLGVSLCDLTYRPVACDEVKVPVDLPPLPNTITVGRDIQESQIRTEREAVGQRNFVFPGMDWLQAEQAADIMVPASAVSEMSEANYQGACNPDFSSRFAAYCMEVQHTGKVPGYLQEKLEVLRKTELTPPAAYMAMAKLKAAIAAVPADNSSAAVRAKKAAVFEVQGVVFEALVERLRCVDLANDGPSRYYLAKLYERLHEPKLALETMREAVEKSWSKSQTAMLADAHTMLGSYIFFKAAEAKRNGNVELNLVRLKNASACFRRAVCLDRTNKVAIDGLITVAKQAIAMDNSFDNQLMLGGAYFIAGEYDRTQTAYGECASKNKDDKRLKVAMKMLAQTQKKQDKQVIGAKPSESGTTN